MSDGNCRGNVTGNPPVFLFATLRSELDVGAQRSAARARNLQLQFVDPAHQGKLFRRNQHRLVISRSMRGADTAELSAPRSTNPGTPLATAASPSSPAPLSKPRQRYRLAVLISAQLLLGDSRQTIGAPAHVCHSGGEPNTGSVRQANHRGRSVASTVCRTSRSTRSLREMRARPSSMSIRPGVNHPPTTAPLHRE